MHSFSTMTMNIQSAKLVAKMWESGSKGARSISAHILSLKIDLFLTPFILLKPPNELIFFPNVFFFVVLTSFTLSELPIFKGQHQHAC